MPRPLINISSRQAYSYAAFLVLYEFLTYIANDMIMPGMLSVVEGFHGPESAVANSLTFYILGGASLQLFLGPLSDRYGRRPVMLFGAILFVICTVFISASQSIDQFLVARFFQGMGLCFIGVVGYATLQEIFAEMDAIRLFSIMANVAILAPLLGPSLGALFIHYFSWRLIFIVISLLSLIALWGLWRFMPESVGQMKRDGERINISALTPRVIFSNYKNLFKNKDFLLGSIGLGVISIPCVSWIALAPVILISDAKLSVIEYGLLQIPVFGAAIAGNLLLHKLSHKGKPLMDMILFGAYISGFSLVMMFILPLLFHSSYIFIMPGLIGYFFGLALSYAPLDRFILFSNSVTKGTASALMSMIAMSIEALGIVIADLIYTTHKNNLYGLFCAGCALLYFIILGCFYRGKKIKSKQILT